MIARLRALRALRRGKPAQWSRTRGEPPRASARQAAQSPRREGSLLRRSARRARRREESPNSAGQCAG